MAACSTWRAASRSISTPAPSRCRAVTKNTAGYLLRPGMDWVDLFVGSEGTLGVVTEARLGLLPAPPAILAGVVFFRDDAAALDAVEAWRGVATGARMLEYLRRAPRWRLLRARFPEIPAAARAALLIEQELDFRGRSRSGPLAGAHRGRRRAGRRVAGSPLRPPTANASATSATRCRSW